MSRPAVTLDAAALAARMNARPLPDDCDGGVWYVAVGHGGTCDGCDCIVSGVCVGCGPAMLGWLLCLPCALADCERAEAAHRAADPHCTCNDCLAYHDTHTTKGA